MKIILTLDFPDAKTKDETRNQCRAFLRAGKEEGMVNVDVVNFAIDKK